MKKNVFELGIPLSREEARKIVGGTNGQTCVTNADCPSGFSCDNSVCREPSTEEKACTGRKEGDPCDFMTDSGYLFTGTCLSFTTDHTLLCSDVP